MRLLPLLLVLAGCAVPGTEGPSRDQEALSRELADRSAGTPQNCISSRGPGALQVVDDRTIVFRDLDTVWVSRLPGACPGLRPLDTLVVETQGSQYCRSDRFRSVQPGSSIPGPYCVLGTFTPHRRR